MDNRNPAIPDHKSSSGSQTCPTCGFVNRAGVLLCENCGTNLLTGKAGNSGTKQFQKPAPGVPEAVSPPQKHMPVPAPDVPEAVSPPQKYMPVTAPSAPTAQEYAPVPETGMLGDAHKADDNASSTVVNIVPPSPKAGEAEAPRKPVDITAYMVEAVMTAGSDVFSDQTLLRLEIEGSTTPVVIEPKSETTLGRRDPATGTMPDVDLTTYAGYRMGVSRKHAIIRRRAGQLDMYDLGSSNGTHINDKRLTPHQPVILRDGDVILLGKMTIRVLFQLNRRQP